MSEAVQIYAMDIHLLMALASKARRRSSLVRNAAEISSRRDKCAAVPEPSFRQPERGEQGTKRLFARFCDRNSFRSQEGFGL